MYQFRIPKDLSVNKVEILGEEAHHIANVLRLKEGTVVGLFDGFGYKTLGIILDVANDRVLVEITNDKVENIEPPINVTLYQALPKKDKFELVIQKATELGVTNIVPIVTKRTIVNIEGEKSKKKVERWSKIAQEACKQSGRAYVPQISEPVSFKTMLCEIKAELNLMPYEAETEKSLKQVLKSYTVSMPKNINILIGPEGGWDKEEVEMAVNRGIIPVTLGPRILRTETASLAVLTLVLYELGDLGGIIAIDN